MSGCQCWGLPGHLILLSRIGPPGTGCYAAGDNGIPHTVVAWDLVLISPEGGQTLTLASWELLEIKVNSQLDTIGPN